MKAAYEVWSTVAWSTSAPPSPSEPYYPMYNAMYAWYTVTRAAWETTGAPQVSNVDTALADLCGAASSAYSSAVSTQSSALSNVNSAAQAKEEAAATLAAAQEAEDAALTAVVSVCPDFDPDSV